MKPVIKVEDLVHVYPTGVKALNGVNLEIHQGEIVGIIGQNGSGKTTLVRHFNGLLKPTQGKVYINGEDSTGQKIGDMARHVGYVFQNPNHQIFCTTVADEILVAPKNFGFSEVQKKENLDRVVEMFSLGEILDKHPLTLDYTTKKLITIASVMVFSPEILILDEPTGGLDEPGRRLLSHIIQIMREHNYTTIIISHDMDYIAENTERIVTMAQGRIIKDDGPSETFRDSEVLVKASIEPPQITQIDLALDPAGKCTLSVNAFISKYQ